jgi:DNA-binding transcriptional MerR regulator
MRNGASQPSRLYRIGELSRLAGVNSRTIDYYTSLGLLTPAKRSSGNYRLYHHETLNRIRRIEQLKAQKYTLEEIREQLDMLDRVTDDEQLSLKLADLQKHMLQLEKEVKELEPVIEQLKPSQAKRLFRAITPQTAACIEALLLLMGKNNFM